MLIISRKKGEGVLIKGKDGDIRIVVTELERGRIRLGIEAPKGYQIFREELLLEIEGTNKLSALKTLDRIKEFIGESSE
jgi:carbon storage regulator